MSSKLGDLENKLSGVFKGAPKLPDGGKKALVQWLPVLAAITGVFMLWNAYTLWNWARVADGITDYANALCSAYSGTGCGVDTRYSLWLWAGVALVGVMGVLYLLAYPGLQARKKQGWNYLFYGTLLEVVYAVVSLFTGYNAGSNFAGALIGSVIGFYLLFQIREAYTGRSAVVGGGTPPTAPKV